MNAQLTEKFEETAKKSNQSMMIGDDDDDIDLLPKARSCIIVVKTVAGLHGIPFNVEKALNEWVIMLTGVQLINMSRKCM